MDQTNQTNQADEKKELRRARWQALRDAGSARFPGAVGRVPNFTGAESAAEALSRQRIWRRATTLACNPDLAQRPVRIRALRAGKRVYLAAAKLTEPDAFLELNPSWIDPRDLWDASSIRGAMAMGRPVTLRQMKSIDLFVIGSVAVAADGARLGQGRGYSDLEYAILREAGLVGPRTPIATTVHPTQVLQPGQIPMRRHDISVDVFVTPERTTRCHRKHRRPAGLLWNELSEAKRAEIPILARGRLTMGRPRGFRVPD